MYPIIDIHCHIYPDKIAEKVTDRLSDFYDITVKYDGKLSSLKKVSSASNISHSVVFSAATAPHQVSSINKFISETVRESKGRMTGLGTLHPDSTDVIADTEELISLGLKGVKFHPDAQGFKADDERCHKIYDACRKYDLPILFHCGDKRYDFSNPDRMKNVLQSYTDLRIVGAHFGGWSVWEKATAELHQFSNFMVDTSSTFKWLGRDAVRKMIDLYSVDRVMFASDYPMWNPVDDIKFLMSLGFSKEEKEKIFYKNAQKLFEIAL